MPVGAGDARERVTSGRDLEERWNGCEQQPQRKRPFP